ncbi:DEKNAAC100589 [Brettanomyces naardenensis]|uniref:DEKNAAC100589 n=1 Tax=Brettanomyces naardenensis TaxID=13370 RepID=A0A448YEE7_BRENA|nr:DEKNAAC100589 [Brettanomyces naardenensis]
MSSTRNYPAVREWLRDPRNRSFWNEDLVTVKRSELGGLGVYARRDIELDPDDNESGLLLRIDKEAILSGPNSFISNLLYDSHVDGILALVLALLYEKGQGKKSPWFEYIDSFDFHDLKSHKLIVPPALWSDENRMLLEGTDAELMGVIDPEDIQSDYTVCLQFAEDNASIVEPPFELSPNTKDPEEENDRKFQLFAAACFAVTSRSFIIDNYQQLALVPAADLFNHDAYGQEDVHFVAIGRVCPFCGKCDDCGHDEYGPPDSEAEEYEMGDVESVGEDDGEDNKETNNEEEDTTPLSMSLIAELDRELDEKKKQEELERAEEESIDGDSEFDASELQLDPDQCCDIVVQKKVRKGQELMNTYGDLSNALLLSKYGFTVKHNPNDVTCLGRQIIAYRDSEGKKADERLQWWSSIGFSALEKYKNEIEEEEGSENAEDENPDNEDVEMNDEDDEDDEDDTSCGDDSDSVDDSWLLAASIDFCGDASLDAICVCNLLVMPEKGFSDLKGADNIEALIKAKMDKKARKLLAELCGDRLACLSGLKSRTFQKYSKGKLNSQREEAICTLLEGERDILEKCITKLG